ncbi:VirB4 family type IV secretion system protein [Arsenophonus nasoniae]|uniref:VirB4 family type IV secretion system protein n=1 Tax=Arsenophonus nasoniae TaxID=638 RepID=A0ABY8NXQ3_9GAMM|nr:VirB4 family type IV secretion system protein [Arsenophonus nasoniae]WGM09135.1 VirB4 family type IV secretion system protein [Arsenophonus nasoniae]
MSTINNISVEKFIPSYTYHVDENIVYLKSGKLITTFVIDGFPFEATDDNQIVSYFEKVKNFLLAIGKEKNLFIWTHIIKKNIQVTGNYHFGGNNFLKGLSDKYIAQFNRKDFFKTTYLLTIGIPVKKDSIQQGIEKIKEIISQGQAVFSEMNTGILGVRDSYLSDIASQYLAYLVNHSETAIPLSGTEIQSSIVNSDSFFGFDVAEIKHFEREDNVYCTNYIVKDFPRGTTIGQWDFLLKLPFEFILTQSFLVDAATKSIKQLQQQVNKLTSTNDVGVTQQEELFAGQESIQSNETLFGSYHAVLSVFGNSVDDAKENGTKIASEFITSGQGFRFVKSTVEAPLTYFSHLPMATYRPLPSKRTLSNLACLFSLHNFSHGKKEGNPIGDGTAIMPLKTTSGTLYHFNTHSSPPHLNVLGQPIAGHALILGASGAGKTTFVGTAAGFLQRFNPDMFVIDFNRSTELFVRAYGGSFFTLQEGKPTGLNPFQLADNDDEELMAFLKRWVKRCAINSDGTVCTDSEAEMIDSAVDAVMRLPRAKRRFGLLLQRINDTALTLRLKKWCGNGAQAWALDSPVNIFDPQAHSKVGFDTTVILKTDGGQDHPACEAVLSVLFFYKDRMQKEGKLMLSIVEEFWKPANFPMTQEMIKESLKAGRMKGEMMWLSSQSPEDAINCEIFPAIAQQTPTKCCLPNPDAIWEGYQKMGLTLKEFSLLKGLDRNSRMILIKQSNSSVFAKLDLYGFDDYLPIISGSKQGISLCEKIRAAVGDNPNDWIPELIQQLKAIKEEQEVNL